MQLADGIFTSGGKVPNPPEGFRFIVCVNPNGSTNARMVANALVPDYLREDSPDWVLNKEELTERLAQLEDCLVIDKKNYESVAQGLVILEDVMESFKD